MPLSFNGYLLSKTSWFRHGIILPYQYINPTHADIPGIYNYSVGMDGVLKDSVNGGIDTDNMSALYKALWESMERYSASITRFPIHTIKELQNTRRENIISPDMCSIFSDEQYEQVWFHWKKAKQEDIYYGEVFSLYNNESAWIPQELIWLWSQTETPNFPSTSTWIAWHFDMSTALRSALQEVLERDALIVTWENCLWWDQIDISWEIYDDVVRRWGEVYAFEITQQWNTQPIIIVCGYLPIRGKRRYWLWAACRWTFEGAFQKAYLEWLQWIIFSWVYMQYNSELTIPNKDAATSFDLHAMYYTCNPEQFEKIPLISKSRKSGKKIILDTMSKIENSTDESFLRLLKSMKTAGIQTFYRNISSSDISQIGMKVVRVICPELSLLHGDEREPFLWWRFRDVTWRYPDKINQQEDYNPFPHFLW